MINKTIKKIHHYRVGFLLLISVLFISYMGLNPVDISKYYGARFGSAIGMSVSIPENPINKLALDLQEKENNLNAKENELAKREAELNGKPDQDKIMNMLMGGGIIVLFILIIINFYLDRNFRNKKS